MLCYNSVDFYSLNSLEKLKARKMKMAIKQEKMFTFPEPFPYYTANVLGTEVMRMNHGFQEAMIKMLFPTWLWNELQRHAHHVEGSSELRVEMLRVAVKQKLWEQYPERPDTPAPMSESFLALRSLLSAAPSHRDDNQSADLICDRDFEDTPDYQWSPALMGRLNHAVDDVEREHGSQGKLQSLWLLYDTVCSLKCFLSYKLSYLPLLSVRTLHSISWFPFYSQSIPDERRVGRRSHSSIPRAVAA